MMKAQPKMIALFNTEETLCKWLHGIHGNNISLPLEMQEELIVRIMIFQRVLMALRDIATDKEKEQLTTILNNTASQVNDMLSPIMSKFVKGH